MTTIGRRDALRRIALAGTWATLESTFAAAQDRAAARPITLLVSGALPDGASRGLQLGVDEGQRMASLLGRELRVLKLNSGTVGDATAILRAESPDPELRPGMALLSISTRPKTGACVFRLACEDSAKADALARWRASRASTRAPAAPDEPLSVVEWHPTLERYGASELNERYTRRFNRAMDADAWLAWAAVKVLTEAVLRSPGIDACAALHQVSFDGHKGRPLRFDEAGTLIQPLYVVNGDIVVGEI